MTGIYEDTNQDGLLDLEGENPDQPVAQYRYDGRNYGILRHTFDSGEVLEARHFYYNSRWQCLEERVEREVEGQTVLVLERQMVWSPRYIDALILRDRDADADLQTGELGKSASGLEERVFYLADANYNVTALVDTNGNVLERYAYDPYGKVTYLDADFAELAQQQSAYSNTTLYTGRELDPATGLYYYRVRYYHPHLGRFLTRDPLGYAAGDTNLYRYCGNTPLVGVDPLGLQDEDRVEVLWGTLPTEAAPIPYYSPREVHGYASIEQTGLTSAAFTGKYGVLKVRIVHRYKREAAGGLTALTNVNEGIIALDYTIWQDAEPVVGKVCGVEVANYDLDRFARGNLGPILTESGWWVTGGSTICGAFPLTRTRPESPYCGWYEQPTGRSPYERQVEEFRHSVSASRSDYGVTGWYDMIYGFYFYDEKGTKIHEEFFIVNFRLTRNPRADELGLPERSPWAVATEYRLRGLYAKPPQEFVEARAKWNKFFGNLD